MSELFRLIQRDSILKDRHINLIKRKSSDDIFIIGTFTPEIPINLELTLRSVTATLILPHFNENIR